MYLHITKQSGPQTFALRLSLTDNGAVRICVRSMVIPIAILLAGISLYAQYADWERAGASPNSANAPAPEDRIDINHASIGALMKVPGMKRPWAQRIVRYRPYHTKQDLLERGIVTDAVYDRIRDYIIAHREKH